MANRYLKRDSGAFEQGIVNVYGRFVVGSTGAVTSGTVKGGGVSTITRTSTGLYRITLQDKYKKMLNFRAWLASASGNSGIATVEPLNATPGNFQSDFATNGYIDVLCLDFAGAAADPAATDIFYFKMELSNSSVDPFGF